VSNQLASGFDHYVHPAEFGLPLWKQLFIYTNFAIKGPFGLLKLLCQSFLSSEGPVWPKSTAANSGFRNFSWTSPISFDIIRKLQMKTHKASVSHVIISAFAMGASKVLGKKIMPEILVAETLALPPYPNDRPVNRLMAYVFPVLTKTQKPEIKIDETRNASWENMTGPQPLLHYVVAKVFGRFPNFFAQKLLCGIKHSVSISNVPGSRNKFNVFGEADLLEFGTWPPQINDGG